MNQPFMEHPSGEFESAVTAMADAIERLRMMPALDKWTTFCAQGIGGRMESYHFATIRMRQGKIVFEKPLDVDLHLVTKLANVPDGALSKTPDGYSVANSTPAQAARLLDVFFRQYLGIRPHDDEGDDYAVAAEW